MSQSVCGRGALKEALAANLNWFENSGVMIPNNGLWGVAERVAIKGNAEMDKIYRSFPAWTEHKDHSIIEQRRPDCNFETAALFLAAAEILKKKQCREVAENILHFLYCRSGTLFRFPPQATLTGTWFWSHTAKGNGFWFDDNGWCCALSLMIANRYPKLDTRYQMKQWGMALADGLVEGFHANFAKEQPGSPEWLGNLNLPHWGAPVLIGLAQAYQIAPKKTYKKVAADYRDYLEKNKETFIASESAYALIGASAAAAALKDKRWEKLARFFGDKLLGRMDPVTGNLPAEHYEAPLGGHLVDTIYTVNWALLGFQCLHHLTGELSYRTAYEKLLGLLIDIQDRSKAKHVQGCWRGMYDLNIRRWGGGDCYEGGANSVYTGWTNAPIALSIAYELTGGSLIKGLPGSSK